MPVPAGALTLLAIASAQAHAALSPIGGEFQVNVFTVTAQHESQVAMATDGSFVVVWNSDGLDSLPDYSSGGVFARRYDSTGQSIATEFQVNTYTTGEQNQPAVAINDTGAFVVAWRSDGQDGAAGGIFGQRFDSAGARLGGELQINNYTDSAQAQPSVAIGAGGAFAVIWQSDLQDGDANGVFGRRFNSSGTALAVEFQVAESTISHQRYPTLARGASGEMVVAWVSPDVIAEGIFARRMAGSGLQGGELQINSYTATNQSEPAVAVGDDGGFAVIWQSGHDGAPSGIFGRLFDSSGAALADDFQVNVYTVGTQRLASIASDGTDFLVAWQSANQDGGDDGVFARVISGSGAVEGAELQTNTYTANGQRGPSVASSGDQFVVVWNSFLQDTSGDAVIARRYSTLNGPALDVDGDGDVDVLTDGLLVLRHLFAFTGTTLTAGAVDTVDCTRCDATAITPYLTGLGAVLDIDGDTANDALTDGLLVLRFLFGFTGTSLTTGAVDTVNCTRCEAATIEPYLLDLD